MKTFKKLTILVAVALLLLATCVAGQMYCSAPAKASPPNYWMCVSKAEIFGAKRACDATGVDKNKKTAVEKATQKCQKDCFSKCSLQVCIPVGRKQ